MKKAILHDGSEVLQPIVVGTMMQLERLMKEFPMLVYELAMISRDRNHKLFGNNEEKLKDISLLQADGKPHNAIRDIINNTVIIENDTIRLINPIKNVEEHKE
jgi:hypothetical protein